VPTAVNLGGGERKNKLSVAFSVSYSASPVFGRDDIMINTNSLTLREVEILRLIAMGYFNKQIAADFNISEQAIKNNMTRILRKLEAVNRTEAVVKAVAFGLVPLDSA
jgi:DNA-binding NarL/FixJ family response regulator